MVHQAASTGPSLTCSHTPLPRPCLQRVHALIGDYHSGLKAIYPININERGHLFTPRIIGAHITLFYYSSFCYLAMRRWDADRPPTQTHTHTMYLS